jgi:O-antigen ligase
MNSLIVGIVFSVASTIAGYVTAPKPDDFGLFRIILAWLAVTLIAFLVRDNLAALMLIGIVQFALAPINPVRRVCFYIGVMAAAPLAFSALIPFPGINYLLILDYAKVTTIFVLGPVFLTAIAAKAPPYLRIIDRLLLVFIILTCVVSFRELPFTSVLRLFVDQTLLIYAPYVAISRTLKKSEHIDAALRALLVSLAIIAFIGLISVARNWNYYTLMFDTTGYKLFLERRNGLLRVYSTLTTTLLALVMGAGIVLVLYMQRYGEMKRHFALGLLGLFALIGFASGSRGGWIAMIVVVLSYFVLTRMNDVLRRLYVYAMGVGFVGVTYRIITDPNFISGDMNNIVYRAELLRTSVKQIAARPLFGEHGFRESARFAHLRQGEGIVDIVNAYLGVALTFGLVGLAIWLAAYLTAIGGPLSQISKLRGRARTDDAAEQIERRSALLLAFMLGYLVMLATVSAVSYIDHYGYLMLALLVAHARGAEAMIRQSAPTEIADAQSDQNAPHPEAAPAPDGPQPYGARFVRRP